MALGKLWNALFGKRSGTETIAAASAVQQPAVVAPGQSAKSAERSIAATKPVSPQPGIAQKAEPVERPILKTKRKAVAGKAKKSAPVPSLAIAAVAETPVVTVKRIAQPKKNAWSKLVAGRQITSILDTNLGDASRAVELLEAIVCDDVPTPKYVAIDSFDLTTGGTTVLQFHQRVRRVGGSAVPIPGTIDEGLRQLSRTIGMVDLVLVDDAKLQWQNDESRRLLLRVTHPGTLVLCRDAKNNWAVLERGVISRPAKPSTGNLQTKLARAA